MSFLKGIQELQGTSTQRKEDESTIDVEKGTIGALAEVGASTHRKEDNTGIDDGYQDCGIGKVSCMGLQPAQCIRWI